MRNRSLIWWYIAMRLLQHLGQEIGSKTESILGTAPAFQLWGIIFMLRDSAKSRDFTLMDQDGMKCERVEVR